MADLVEGGGGAGVRRITGNQSGTQEHADCRGSGTVTWCLRFRSEHYKTSRCSTHAAARPDEEARC